MQQNGTKRRSAGESGEGKRQSGTLVGLDIGYGHTKIAFHDGSRHLFPSAVAAIAPGKVEQYGATVEPDEVVVDSIRCIVGHRAIAHPDRFDNLHSVWWILPQYRAILNQVAKVIPPQSTVVAGLPLQAYMAPESKELVKNLVKTALKAKRVFVVPQGVGAYYYGYGQTTDVHDHVKIALVDIGTRTTECVAMMGRENMANLSAGFDLGVSDIYATIARELTEKLRRSVDPYEVEGVIRHERQIRAEGRGYDPQSIESRVAQLTSARANDIRHRLVSLWGERAPEFDLVVFCGGGSHLLYSSLKSYRDGAILMEEAQFSNALGFLAIGALMAPEEAQPDIHNHQSHPAAAEPASTSVVAG